MEPESDRLMELLFSSNFPNEWKNNSSFNSYISKVGTLSSEELIHEPMKLRNEKHAIQDQTQELAINNYNVFLETGQCSQSLFEKFSKVEHKVDELLENIPLFGDKVEGFLDKTKNINAVRRLNSLTLTRNALLLEILELPQLMESFINGSFYEDALELASYVKRLNSKHDIQIIKAIKDDTKKLWLTMLKRLLEQLQHDLQLPKSLQLVAYLRRMEIFTEPELRLKFLQARTTWINNCLKIIPKDDAYHYLTKVIEVTRVNLFSIITQYKAIFNDDDHSPLASSKSDLINYNIIFFNWISDRILLFLTMLEEGLNRGIWPLDTILRQCMYFGLSFSRVGCDFRSLMVPIFIDGIKKMFRIAVSKATINFEKNMEKFTFINKTHSNVMWKSKGTESSRPPENLLDFYPLAEYLNQILTLFNELRSCFPIAIIEDVIYCLEESLLTISKAILILYNAEHQAFSTSSKEACGRFCICFTDNLIPYLQKCLHTIFPPNSVASYLGISMQTLQKEGILTINKEKVTKPIQFLLPAKIDPILYNINIENKTDPV